MILIASPSSVVRARWRQGLHSSAGAVHEVAERAALEQSLGTLRPAVLLLDLNLPGFEGAADLAALQARSPASKLIAMASEPNEEEGLAMLLGGARGYCHKGLDGSLLRKAVDVVQKGEIWAGRTLTAQLLEELTARIEAQQRTVSSRTAARLERLTRREREIALLVGGGASNKEIGSKLGVTERTVKAHLTSIFRKVGVSDRLRLALFVNDHDPTPGL
jgi:two-component system nitrate/nitrite response regulator NarL